MRPLVGVGEPERSLPGHDLKLTGQRDVCLPEMRPGHDDVGLCPQAAKLGQRRDDRRDQFFGYRAKALG